MLSAALYFSAMSHNFWRSLEYESSKFQLADDFYFEQLGVERIVRFDSGSEEDMEFQRADIDVQLHGWGRHANVSEKFRKKDFNDLYLELYSMYPDTKGWMERNEADFLAYFFPDRVLWINKHELHELFHRDIHPLIEQEWLEGLVKKFPKKNGRQNYQKNGLEISLIKAYNRTRSKNWDTLGVTVSLDLVREAIPKMKEYQLNGPNFTRT